MRLDGTKESGIDGNSGHDHGKFRVYPRQTVAQRAVYEPPRLFVRTGQVNGAPVPRYCDLDIDIDILPAAEVMIQYAATEINPVRPPRNFRTYHLLAVVEQIVDGAQRRFQAVFCYQANDAIFAYPAGANHRAQVAHHDLRQPVIRREQLENIPAHLTLLIKFHGRQSKTLLPDLVRL